MKPAFTSLNIPVRNLSKEEDLVHQSSRRNFDVLNNGKEKQKTEFNWLGDERNNKSFTQVLPDSKWDQLRTNKQTIKR